KYAGDDRLSDEDSRARSRDQIPEQVQRARFDVDAGGCEDHVVDVACPRIGDLVVQRLPQLVPPPELGLVARERPAAALRASPRRVDVDVEVNDEGIELVEQVPRLDRAAADGDHARFAAVARVADEARFDLPECALALLGEEVPDRAFRTLDL